MTEYIPLEEKKEKQCHLIWSILMLILLIFFSFTTSSLTVCQQEWESDYISTKMGNIHEFYFNDLQNYTMGIFNPPVYIENFKCPKYVCPIFFNDNTFCFEFFDYPDIFHRYIRPGQLKNVYYFRSSTIVSQSQNLPTYINANGNENVVWAQNCTLFSPDYPKDYNIRLGFLIACAICSIISFFIWLIFLCPYFFQFNGKIWMFSLQLFLFICLLSVFITSIVANQKIIDFC